MIFLGNFNDQQAIKAYFSMQGYQNINPNPNVKGNDLNVTSGTYFRYYTDSTTKSTYWTIDVNGSNHSVRISNYNWSADPGGSSSNLDNITIYRAAKKTTPPPPPPPAKGSYQLGIKKFDRSSQYAKTVGAVFSVDCYSSDYNLDEDDKYIYKNTDRIDYLNTESPSYVKSMYNTNTDNIELRYGMKWDKYVINELGAESGYVNDTKTLIIKVQSWEDTKENKLKVWNIKTVYNGYEYTLTKKDIWCYIPSNAQEAKNCISNDLDFRKSHFLINFQSDGEIILYATNPLEGSYNLFVGKKDNDETLNFFADNNHLSCAKNLAGAKFTVSVWKDGKLEGTGNEDEKITINSISNRWNEGSNNLNFTINTLNDDRIHIREETPPNGYALGNVREIWLQIKKEVVNGRYVVKQVDISYHDANGTLLGKVQNNITTNLYSNGAVQCFSSNNLYTTDLFCVFKNKKASGSYSFCFGKKNMNEKSDIWNNYAKIYKEMDRTNNLADAKFHISIYRNGTEKIKDEDMTTIAGYWNDGKNIDIPITSTAQPDYIKVEEKSPPAGYSYGWIRYMWFDVYKKMDENGNYVVDYILYSYRDKDTITYKNDNFSSKDDAYKKAGIYWFNYNGAATTANNGIAQLVGDKNKLICAFFNDYTPYTIKAIKYDTNNNVITEGNPVFKFKWAKNGDTYLRDDAGENNKLEFTGLEKNDTIDVWVTEEKAPDGYKNILKYDNDQKNYWVPAKVKVNENGKLELCGSYDGRVFIEDEYGHFSSVLGENKPVSKACSVNIGERWQYIRVSYKGSERKIFIKYFKTR